MENCIQRRQDGFATDRLLRCDLWRILSSHVDLHTERYYGLLYVLWVRYLWCGWTGRLEICLQAQNFR